MYQTIKQPEVRHCSCEEINGSTADILLELYDDQRKILSCDCWQLCLDCCFGRLLLGLGVC